MVSLLCDLVYMSGGMLYGVKLVIILILIILILIFAIVTLTFFSDY